MKKENLFRFDSNTKQKKFVKYSLIFLIAVFIGIFIYSTASLIINADKTATIEVLVAPSDSTLTIDGRNFPTKTTIRIKPGTYSVKIEKDGFISYNNSITAEDKRTVYLYEYLNEEDENGTFYQNNEEENQRTQQIYNKKADLFHEEYTGTDNIWNITPYDNYNQGYRIFAEKDDNKKILVNIYLYTCSDSKIEDLKTKALNYLKENNINPENYVIEYSSCL